MAKSKKWICAEKIETSKAKNLEAKDLCIASELFWISEAKAALTKLWQAFIEALISNHFNPEHYIQIKTNASDYAIGQILNQLNLDNLGQWYPVTFFCQKRIPAKPTTKPTMLSF